MLLPIALQNLQLTWIGNIFHTITTDNSLVFDYFQLEFLLPKIALLFSIYTLYL